MDDEKEKEERWRQLAELLGLPPEEAGAARRETPAAAPPQMAPAIPVVPPASPKWEPEVVLPPVPEEPYEPSIETVVVDDFEEYIPDEAPAVETERMAPAGADAEGPEEAEAPALEGDEEKPRRGRRRRRRGRRRGGADRAEGAEPQKSEPGKPAAAGGARTEKAPPGRPPREPSRDSHDRQAPRGQRRGRDENAPVQARADVDDRWEQEEHPVEEVEDVVSAPAHDDDDDADILSDWNAPSWQELISSLYRPDR